MLHKFSINPIALLILFVCTCIAFSWTQARAQTVPGRVVAVVCADGSHHDATFDCQAYLCSSGWAQAHGLGSYCTSQSSTGATGSSDLTNLFTSAIFSKAPGIRNAGILGLGAIITLNILSKDKKPAVPTRPPFNPSVNVASDPVADLRRQLWERMYADLKASLKITGLQQDLGLKGIAVPPGLRLKSSSGELLAGGYGVCGLPGIYVGGPRVDCPTDGGLQLKVGTGGDSALSKNVSTTNTLLSSGPEVGGVKLKFGAGTESSPPPPEAVAGNQSAIEGLQLKLDNNNVAVASGRAASAPAVSGVPNEPNSNQPALSSKEVIPGQTATNQSNQAPPNQASSNQESRQVGNLDPAALDRKLQDAQNLGAAANSAATDEEASALARKQFEQAANLPTSAVTGSNAAPEKIAPSPAANSDDIRVVSATDFQTPSPERPASAGAVARPSGNLQEKPLTSAQSVMPAQAASFSDKILAAKIAKLRVEVNVIQQSLRGLARVQARTESERRSLEEDIGKARDRALCHARDMFVAGVLDMTKGRLETMLDENSKEMDRALQQTVNETDHEHKIRLMLASKMLQENQQTIQVALERVKMADHFVTSAHLGYILSPGESACKPDGIWDKGLEILHTAAAEVLDNAAVQNALGLGVEAAKKYVGVLKYGKDAIDSVVDVSGQVLAIHTLNNEIANQSAEYGDRVKVLSQRMRETMDKLKGVEAMLATQQAQEAGVRP